MGENNTPVASSDEVISQKKQNSGPVASILSSGVISQKKQKTGPKSGLVGHHGPSDVWNHFAKKLSKGTNKYSGTGATLIGVIAMEVIGAALLLDAFDK
ncbi:hypothetical protein IFM89_015566 [Coptis chinensis]|uniref:Uncharacterized protein n=1 Tax=Coptis chinensis TaxID=261450 RepID=A0A835H5E9_9MAGN|nr:hypothetical protein IFM89_015566 [Coptis chinensis]